MKKNVLLSNRFIPLFITQFFGATNDNAVKNVLLVMVTFQGLHLAGVSPAQIASVASILFILPFFLLSSVAGKVADSYPKVKLVRMIKIIEILIILVSIAGILFKNAECLLAAVFALGCHSTFFGPIKYSILPQYITERKKLLLANAYVELGTFIAVLLGQTVGSWFMATNQLLIVICSLLAFSIIGFIASLRMPEVAVASEKFAYRWNIFADTHQSCKKIFKHKAIKNNLHAISWFWALGVIYTIQLPEFTKVYLGGNAEVFSIILTLFSVGIGIGSVVCAKLSGEHIIKKYAIFGLSAVSILSIIMLLTHTQKATQVLNLFEYVHTLKGALTLIVLFLVGLFAGFYSVTCYNEIQVVSPLKILSQVISVNNILNALYMVLASVACSLVLLFTDTWGVFMALVLINFLFVYRYYIHSQEV